ncbi:MAG: hypothetical protein R3B48_13125 [Kofleriaceae bacterium]
MSPYPVERVLRWFDLDSGWLRGEEVLDVPLPELLAAFSLPPDDLMINVYPVGPQEEAWLRPRIRHRLDRDTFTYAVEARHRLDGPDGPE